MLPRGCRYSCYAFQEMHSFLSGTAGLIMPVLSHLSSLIAFLCERVIEFWDFIHSWLSILLLIFCSHVYWCFALSVKEH